jgi:hypothetical protein
MFESVIAYILNKYLAGYIGELDYKNLQLGLFSGKLTLKDVKIQPSALVCIFIYFYVSPQIWFIFAF